MRCDRCGVIFEKYSDYETTIRVKVDEKKYEDRKLYSGLNLCPACNCCYAFLVSDWIREKQNSEVYNCDPSKNVECSKNECYTNGGYCRLTTNELYSRSDESLFKFLTEGEGNV